MLTSRHLLRSVRRTIAGWYADARAQLALWHLARAGHRPRKDARYAYEMNPYTDDVKRRVGNVWRDRPDDGVI